MNSHENDIDSETVQEPLPSVLERSLLNNSDFDDDDCNSSEQTGTCSFSQWKYHGTYTEQNSQEENSEVTILDATKNNGKLFRLSQREKIDHMNSDGFDGHCFTQYNSMVNKSNLRCQDEKQCCCYMKFPVKVNNNIYPEKSIPEKDGMEEYFQQFSLNPSPSQQSTPKDNVPSSSMASSCTNCSKSLDEQDHCYDSSHSDQSNALNGDEVDEDDGCIYTYKGDGNFTSNFSHLLQTCFSCGLPLRDVDTDQKGPLSIQRILNGSSQSNPHAHNDLYSPEMDFLEMDFDPGSNGGESDCEDNNSSPNLIIKPEDSISLENFTIEQRDRLKRKNTIPKDIRSLMCRRCEVSLFSERKVNNIHTVPVKQNSECTSNGNFLSNFSTLPTATSSYKSNGPTTNVNLKGNSSCTDTTGNSNLNLSINGLNFPTRNTHSEENNLSAVQYCNGDLSEGEDADDESGDDCASAEFSKLSSTPRYLLKDTGHNSIDRYSFKLKNSAKTNKQIRFLTKNDLAYPHSLNSDASSSSVEGASSDELVRLMIRNVKVTNSCSGIENNNNLGSISAPEVSPSKDFSPLENFSRSISFHNQLSSPKYENVCFSQPYKENVLSSLNNNNPSASGRTCRGDNSHICSHSGNSSSTTNKDRIILNLDYSNLEACVDRLCQRQRSVFNIMSSVDSSSSQKPLIVNGNCNENNSSVIAQTSISPGNRTQFSEEDDDYEEKNTLGPLPCKVLQPKMTDLPFSDPNMALVVDIDSELDIDASSPHLEKVMIWTERQATFKQVSQVGVSSCGPTAVLNALLALGHSKSVDEVTDSIKARLRAENSPLVSYLLSRSWAGTTHQDLISGIEDVSEGAVRGRFFHMFPKRAFQLSRWLASWIKKGGVPIATLNLQVGVPHGQTVPDAWHHQMVFGVGPQGIYLTNPLECVSDSLLADQLCSDSVLLVRRTDITSRWDQSDQLIQLSLQSDPRWNEMNVLGQVVCVLKEDVAPEMLQGRRHLTYHVAIPASYNSGVSIFVRSDNETCLQELMSAPELPLLD